MPSKTKSIVLDSWSVIAYLQDEPAGTMVGDLLADVIETGGDALMTVVNAGEVWYIFAREQSERAADAAIADLHQIGIQFIEADWTLTRAAGLFKARGKISHAAAFAAALASQMKCELITGDPEFKSVASDIKIRWL